MTGGIPEQRNPYKGKAPRAWLRIRLRAPDGAVRELELLADTGCPFALLLREAALADLAWQDAGTVNSNLGALSGGWLRLAMPTLALDEFVLGYASEAAVAIAKRNSPDFEGLVGLPLLRLGEYGGDANSFWLRVGPPLS